MCPGHTCTHVQTRVHCLAGSLGRPLPQCPLLGSTGISSVSSLDARPCLVSWSQHREGAKSTRLLSAASRANDSRAVRATVTERPDTLDTALTTQATEVGLFPAKVALVSSSREAHRIEGCVLSVCLSHESVGPPGAGTISCSRTHKQSGSLSKLMSERRVSRVPVLLWSPPL